MKYLMVLIVLFVGIGCNDKTIEDKCGPTPLPKFHYRDKVEIDVSVKDPQLEFYKCKKGEIEDYGRGQDCILIYKIYMKCPALVDIHKTFNETQIYLIK
ncbi:MAG: hypothetical protein PHF86_10290 [Candidatus Nanoarchaeia archaeon]|nr:hypothetical protein [Candidatus Nanoarchaeia archaeon]